MTQVIEQLKNKALVWQGNQFTATTDYLTSGYQALDAALGGGLPVKGVIDVRTMMGIGELRLLLPYLACASSKAAVVFIAPPSLMSAESLASAGVDIKQVVVLSAGGDDALWCAEQCLKSGSCASVVLWHQQFEIHQIRRLSLACEQGEASLFIMRSPQPNTVSLPVTLTLSLAPSTIGINVSIDKRKAGAPVAQFSVDMAELWPEFANKDNISRTEAERMAVHRSSNVVPFTELKRRA